MAQGELLAAEKPADDAKQTKWPHRRWLGDALFQSGRAVQELVEMHIAQTGKSLLSSAVLLYGYCGLENETCAGCGGAFTHHNNGAGTAVVIELRPDGNSLYHCKGNLEPDCWPADVPFWHSVIQPPSEELEQQAEQLNLFDPYAWS